jgi:hypothetical protein
MLPDREHLRREYILYHLGGIPLRDFLLPVSGSLRRKKEKKEKGEDKAIQGEMQQFYPIKTTSILLSSHRMKYRGQLSFSAY